MSETRQLTKVLKNERSLSHRMHHDNSILNRGADRVLIPPSEPCKEGGVFYEYIRRIYDIAYVWNTCSCNFGICQS